MPGVAITDIQGLVDPYKQYQFTMMITPVLGVTNYLDTQTLSLRCTATAIPGSTLPQIPVELGGFRLFYNGMRTFSGQWTTTFIEGQDINVIRQIGSWMQLIYDQTTGVGNFKAQYQAEAVIDMYDDPASVRATRTLFGVWPTIDPDKPLTFAANARVDVPITWSFDYWEDDATSSGG